MNSKPSLRESLTCTSYRSDLEPALGSPGSVSQQTPLLGSSSSGVPKQGFWWLLFADANPSEVSSVPLRTRNLGRWCVVPAGHSERGVHTRSHGLMERC